MPHAGLWISSLISTFCCGHFRLNKLCRKGSTSLDCQIEIVFSRQQLTWSWQHLRFALKSESYPFRGILIFHFTALSKTAGSVRLSIHRDFPKCLGLVHWLLIYVEIWWCALCCYGKPSVQNQHPLCITKSQYGLFSELAELRKLFTARPSLPLMNFGTFLLSPRQLSIA